MLLVPETPAIVVLSIAGIILLGYVYEFIRKIVKRYIKKKGKDV